MLFFPKKPGLEGQGSGMGDSQRDSRQSFALETPMFKAGQADSPESLELPRESSDSRESCESIRANHATIRKIPNSQKIQKMGRTKFYSGTFFLATI